MNRISLFSIWFDINSFIKLPGICKAKSDPFTIKKLFMHRKTHNNMWIICGNVSFKKYILVVIVDINMKGNTYIIKPHWYTNFFAEYPCNYIAQICICNSNISNTIICGLTLIQLCWISIKRIKLEQPSICMPEMSINFANAK